MVVCSRSDDTLHVVCGVVWYTRCSVCGYPHTMGSGVYSTGVLDVV